MNLQEEIAKVARELYENSERIEGRDRDLYPAASQLGMYSAKSPHL